MPTISQLPRADATSAADEVPISQGGSARSISLGALLASAQPAIIVDSPALLGRVSLGSGAPEQVDVGVGINLFSGTLVANGLDHAVFPMVSGLSTEADLVISNQGSPMLMQASLLRGLFSAGQNVAIDRNGVISTTSVETTTGTVVAGNSIAGLAVVPGLAAQDLVAVSHAGLDHAIAYDNFLGGVTIDQAQSAGPSGDSDTIWIAQSSNVMSRQSFGAIWVWVASKLPSYKVPVIEITNTTNLDTTVHNGRVLVCSQPVTLIPLTNNMGNGFHCTVINVSSGNIILGSGFVSSSGSLVLSPWQSATLTCVTYSGGTVAFAVMPPAALTTAVPGQPSFLVNTSVTAATISISWQSPTTGGIVLSYIVQYRPTGTVSWTTNIPVVNTTTFLLTGLQAATGYEITVTAQNAIGTGTASAILTAATASLGQPTVPSQVSGLTATSISSSVIQINWSSQTGISAATSFTIQYRLTGSSSWTFSVTGMTGTKATISGLQPATSYDISIIGANSAGTAPTSLSVVAVTQAASAVVNSITWNLVPSGTYNRGNGTIAVNVLVVPVTSPIKLGFSLSPTSPPSSWTTALLVSNNLWGAYVPTPTAAGSWYAWAVGLDGSAPTVSPSPFLVQ